MIYALQSDFKLRYVLGCLGKRPNKSSKLKLWTQKQIPVEKLHDPV
jgi:hypothetical protein